MSELASHKDPEKWADYEYKDIIVVDMTESEAKNALVELIELFVLSEKKLTELLDYYKTWQD
jgi:hypothetical protein